MVFNLENFNVQCNDEKVQTGLESGRKRGNDQCRWDESGIACELETSELEMQ